MVRHPVGVAEPCCRYRCPSLVRSHVRPCRIGLSPSVHVWAPQRFRSRFCTRWPTFAATMRCRRQRWATARGSRHPRRHPTGHRCPRISWKTRASGSRFRASKNVPPVISVDTTVNTRSLPSPISTAKTGTLPLRDRETVVVHPEGGQAPSGGPLAVVEQHDRCVPGLRLRLAGDSRIAARARRRSRCVALGPSGYPLRTLSTIVVPLRPQAPT